mmetsp:Transcript_6489/g.16105  ORF Transcript_6489/g.16105 Transcript_6489/m.16105 type:complete len:201 (-) Transcript_6489:2713-3315(-)
MDSCSHSEREGGRGTVGTPSGNGDRRLATLGTSCCSGSTILQPLRSFSFSFSGWTLFVGPIGWSKLDKLTFVFTSEKFLMNSLYGFWPASPALRGWEKTAPPDFTSSSFSFSPLSSSTFALDFTPSFQLIATSRRFKADGVRSIDVHAFPNKLDATPSPSSKSYLDESKAASMLVENELESATLRARPVSITSAKKPGSC